jgi:hypothetical protein
MSIGSRKYKARRALADGLIVGFEVDKCESKSAKKQRKTGDTKALRADSFNQTQWAGLRLQKLTVVSENLVQPGN